MTLAWGFGLVLEAAVSAMLVFRLPVQTYLLVGPIVGYGTMGALTAWTFWYARRTRRMGDARRGGQRGPELFRLNAIGCA
jgi:FtsH-binding integral membrane protein